MMLRNPDWATGEMILHSIGYIGVLLMGIAMLCAVLSGMNAFYLSGSRLMFSMSYADALPAFFGKLHHKYGTPHKATFFLMGISLICPLFGRQVLSFVPGSPGFLSVPSMIILLVWIALGIIFFIRIKDNFLHGKWEGVSVEKILLSKMKAETNQ